MSDVRKSLVGGSSGKALLGGESNGKELVGICVLCASDFLLLDVQVCVQVQGLQMEIKKKGCVEEE